MHSIKVTFLPLTYDYKDYYRLRRYFGRDCLPHWSLRDYRRRVRCANLCHRALRNLFVRDRISLRLCLFMLWLLYGYHHSSCRDCHRLHDWICCRIYSNLWRRS
jgi:hypothetical protein